MPASACGATSAGSTPVRQREQRALVDEHVLREAAVARQPGELVALAVHVEPASARARRARSCRPDRRARRRRPRPPSRRRRPRAPSPRSRGRARPAGARPAGSMSPSIACRSVAHTPAPPILTTTLRGRVGLGLGPLDELERAVVLAEERGLSCARLRRGSRSRSASRCSASRVASAMIVSDGFTDSVRGTSDASPTKSRFTSCDSPLPVDDRARRVVAHAAAALHVRGDETGPADLRRARRLEHLPAELERAVDALALGRLKVDVEPLRAVLVDDDGRVVVVVRHREQPDPVPEPPHRLDEARPPERPALVARASSRRRSGPGSSWPRSRSPRPRRAGASRSGR